MFKRWIMVTTCIGVIGAIALTFLLSRQPKFNAAPEGPYNVLLITLDTTRADRLGCYGYIKGTSPNLDALARDGVRFDNCVSASAVTPMSHASILTGLYPHQHGLRVFYGQTGYYLPKSVPTLAGILRQHGWHTAAFVSAYPVSRRFGLDSGFDVFKSEVADSVMQRDPAKRGLRDGRWERKRQGAAQRRADATTDQALEWLHDVDGPFLLWVHYFDPHDESLIPPKEITERFHVLPSTPTAPLDIYDAEVFFMDQQFGRLIDFLKETGQYGRTVIAVIADHGQGLGDHEWFQHRILYQEQVRLPFILHMPGGRRDAAVSAVVRSIDLLPTVLEAVDVEAPASLEGETLVPLMAGEDGPQRSALAESLNTLDAHANSRRRDWSLPECLQDDLFCVVAMPWKLILHRLSPSNSELYNLNDDPSELRNVIENYPAVAERLTAQLEASGMMHIQIEDPEAPMDDDTADKLRALGYLPSDE